jgi:hypothetical protein
MEGMEKHDRDFKGVWIPKEIWLSENLSLMELTPTPRTRQPQKSDFLSVPGHGG